MPLARIATGMVHPLTTVAEQSDDSTTDVGEGNAAEIDLGRVSTKVDVFAEVSGAATITVEVSTDGETWREAATTDLGAAGTDFQQYDFAYRFVRAYADANLTTLEVVGRGI